VSDQRLVNFSSNDYLGLANDPRLTAAAHDAIGLYGVGAGAAGLLSGWTDAHDELANALQVFMARDRALLFSSGYMANLGVVAALADRHTDILHDRLNHASLIDAVKLSGAHSIRYRHADPADFESRIPNNPAHSQMLLSDTVFSMDGDLAPVSELAAIAKAHKVLPIFDDAHGFGVMGNGRGLIHAAGLTQEQAPLVVVTFGKALGTAGAAVIGRADLVESLLQRARPFIYDTAMPPLIAAATHRALQLLDQDSSLLRRLHQNIAAFQFAMDDAGLPPTGSSTPIQPIMLGGDELALAMANKLREAGFYVRAIRPPTVPEGTSRLRICLSAAHTADQISGLVLALKRLLPAKVIKV
jgi:8-amino-7-oxononanoate synthase